MDSVYEEDEVMGILDNLQAQPVDPLDAEIDSYLVDQSDLFATTPPPPSFPGLDAYIRERGFNPTNIRNDLNEDQLSQLRTSAEGAWTRKESGNQFFDSGLQSPMGRVMNVLQGPEPSQVFDAEIQAVLDDQYDRAKEAGVDFEGAPRTLQNQLWFVPETNDSPRAMATLLSQYYTEALGDDKYLIHDFKVQREPHTNRLMYENPETGQATFFFAPGIQAMDIGMESPKIAAMIGANLATTYATKSVSLPTSVASDVVSFGGLRYGELALARKRGLLKTDLGEGVRNWTDEEIKYQIAKELLLVGGASASIPVAIRLITPVLKAATNAKIFDPVKSLPFSMPEFVQVFEQVKSHFAALGPKAEELFSTLSAPQVMKAAVQMDNVNVVPATPTGRMAAEATERYTPEVFPDTLLRQMDEIKIQESGKTSKLLQEAEKKQTDVFSRVEGEVFEEGSGGTASSRAGIIDETGQASKSKLGTDIIDVAESVVAPAVAAETKVLSQMADKPLKAAKDFVDAAGSRSAIEIGEAGTKVRGSLQKAKDDALDNWKVENNAIQSTMKFGRVVDVEPIIQNSKNLIKKMNSDIYPTIEKETFKSWLTDPLTTGVTKEGTGKKITMSQLDDIIKKVREAKRDAIGGANPNTAEFKALQQIEGVWMDIQEATIREQAEKIGGEAGEVLLKRVNDNKVAYREIMETFETGLVDDLLERVPGSTKKFGEYSLDDVAFTNRLLTQGSEGDTIVLREILGKAENRDALDYVTGAIKQSYKDKMYSGPSGFKILSKESHDTWYQANRKNIERFFEPEDIAAYKNADSAAAAVEKRMLQQEALIADLNATPWGTNLTKAVNKPSTIFNKTWGRENFDQSRELFNILKKGGDAGEEVINGYKSQIMRDILDKTKKMNNQEALEKYIDVNRDALDIWYGKEFANGLETHMKIMKIFKPGTGSLKGPGLANRNYVYKMATDAARMYVGLFTRPGRALTFASRLGFNVKQKRVVKDLLNPQDLVDRYKATQWMTDPTVQGTLRALQVFNILDDRPVGKETGADVEKAEELSQTEVDLNMGYYGLNPKNSGGRVLMPLEYDL